MNSFEELVTARKNWINDVLKPWCGVVRRSDLLKAEPDWIDIAGKVDLEKTLWAWAWSRFPDLVHASLGIDESSELEIGLTDGRIVVGFPDARKSLRGQLFIWGHIAPDERPMELGPFSIDEIRSVRFA